LISVSCDHKKEDVEQFLAREPMPWVHWFAGWTRGPLYDWNINVYPTIYIIDAKGIIRYKEIAILNEIGELVTKQLRGAVLEKAVDSLLAEVEKN
jgi:hypothetical protein